MRCYYLPILLTSFLVSIFSTGTVTASTKQEAADYRQNSSFYQRFLHEPIYFIPVFFHTRSLNQAGQAQLHIPFNEVLLQYRYYRHQASLSWWPKNTWKFQYLFPLNTSLQGVVQFFDGYGPHILSYNRRHTYCVA